MIFQWPSLNSVSPCAFARSSATARSQISGLCKNPSLSTSYFRLFTSNTSKSFLQLMTVLLSRSFPPGHEHGDRLSLRVYGGRCTLRVALLRPRRNLPHAFYRGVDIGIGVECTDRESHGTVDIQGSVLLVNQWCAVQAGARRDFMIDVEHGADVACFEPLDVDADGREVVFEVVAAVEPHTFDCLEVLYQFPREFDLAGMNVFDAVLVEPVLPSPKSGDAHHVRSPKLHAPWILFEVIWVSR